MSNRRWWKPQVDPLSLKFAIAVTALVVGTLIPALYVAIQRHHETQLELERRAVRAQGELIRIAFEHQMVRRDRSLIRKMVSAYGADPEVATVMILDRRGKIAFSSEPSIVGNKFDRERSPACQICHDKPPEERDQSVLLEREGGTVIRSVIPFANKPRCHECHRPEDKINGVLVIDTPVEETRAQVRDDIRDMVVGVCLMALVLLGGSRLVIRRLILEPLARLEDRTRAIAAGDFTKRVPLHGSNALAQLGREFNAMAESVSTLLGEVKRKRKQLEDVMNSVDDGLIVIDETFTVMGVNESFARRLGCSRRDLLYRRCYEIGGGATGCHQAPGDAGAECPAVRCFATGKLQTGGRTRRDLLTGTSRQEEVYASPIFDASGRVVQVVEVWRDITDRKSREAKMAEIQHLASLGMLASGFSHEMNTPLTTMLFSVESVQRALSSGELSEDRLETTKQQAALIRSEILRCREITRQFLTLSRGQDVAPDLLELPRTIDRVLPIVAPTAKESGVEVMHEPGGEVPIVRANDGAVQQVLLNLLINAVHASKSGDVVRVRHGAEDSIVWIKVIDEGTGIPDDARERVFEPFFTGRASGTGLGLFVSLNLARKWGGDIRVSSAEGKGSTFEVRFPVVKGDA